jgi:protein-L-isoaspartate(D-aspartate) O-methyltransferase
MNFRSARLAMVESQIRPNAVRDVRILNAFATVPRELYVPEHQRALAYMDEALPVAESKGSSKARFLLPPMVLARLLEAAAPNQSDKLLDVGGVTGYSAAIASALCKEVVALEASESLVAMTRENLAKANEKRVKVVTGALTKGAPEFQPFDVIVLNGSVSSEPHQLFAQLAEGGRLVTLIGNRMGATAMLFTKSEGVTSGRGIFDAGVEVLPGFEPELRFVF